MDWGAAPGRARGGSLVSRSYFHPRCKATLEVVFDGRGAPNSKPFHLEVDPRSASVGLNGFYEADTFQLEIDARVLPFDPDQVAYCAVRIYMWDSARNLNQTEWATENNEMIRGLVDDVDVNIVGEDTMITFSGRDYTALLVDAEWDAKDKVKSGSESRLDEVVQSIADEAAPEGTQARFEVVWAGEDDPPICGGLARSTKRKGLWVKPGKSYWDVIWDLCIQHSYVVHVEGSRIFITEPVTQTKLSLESAPMLVYGQSLTKLDIKRKFSREVTPQVVIRAWDPVSQKPIEVKYPAKRNIKITGTDALGTPLTVKKDEQMFFPAPAGVIDKKALLRYARNRFYHLGRGETVYSMTTSHLWIDGVGENEDGSRNSEINLLRLRPGFAIGVLFDPFNRDLLRKKEIGERVEHILGLGYSEQVATFVANNLDRLEMFRQHYYYNRGTIDYSIDDGIEIEIEAANFSYEVREIHFAELDAGRAA